MSLGGLPCGSRTKRRRQPICCLCLWDVRDGDFPNSFLWLSDHFLQMPLGHPKVWLSWSSLKRNNIICTFLHTYLGRFLSGWWGQMKDIEDQTQSSFWKGHHDQRTLWLIHIHITYKFPLPPNPRKKRLPSTNPCHYNISLHNDSSGNWTGSWFGRSNFGKNAWPIATTYAKTNRKW